MTEKLPPAPFSREDFEGWLEHPITLWVKQACLTEAKELQDRWVDMSWVGGKADQETLREMRGMAACLEAKADPSYNSICDVLGQEPQW